MTPDDHEMDDYERELVEEAWGFAEQASPRTHDEEDREWFAQALAAELRRQLPS